MRDRRRSPRFRCRVPCVLRLGRKQVPGVLQDVSRSGLSIHTATALGQGDEVEILVARNLRVPAIAWHVRRAPGGFAIGMMLSAVSAEYERFVEGWARRRPAAAPAPPAESPLPAEPPPAAEPEAAGCWWRLRVKEVDGPRTRVVVLEADSHVLAIEQAMGEIGSGWEVLEARPTTPKRRAAS